MKNKEKLNIYDCKLIPVFCPRNSTRAIRLLINTSTQSFAEFDMLNAKSFMCFFKMENDGKILIIVEPG